MISAAMIQRGVFGAPLAGPPARPRGLLALALRLLAAVQHRPGKQRHPPVVRRLVAAVLLVEVRDVAEQTGQDAAVDRPVGGVPKRPSAFGHVDEGSRLQAVNADVSRKSARCSSVSRSWAWMSRHSRIRV
jgi:hypothetical protein